MLVYLLTHSHSTACLPQSMFVTDLCMHMYIHIHIYIYIYSILYKETAWRWYDVHLHRTASSGVSDDRGVALLMKMIVIMIPVFN